MLFLFQSFGRPRRGGSMQRGVPLVKVRKDDDDDLLLAAWMLYMSRWYKNEHSE